MTVHPLGLAAALAAGLFCLAPAAAQAQPCYGVEDGYEDNEFGWGPQYRCDTTFRPAIGFYGGVERPYPYGGNPSVNPVTRNGVTYGYNPNVPGGIGPIAPQAQRSAEPRVRVSQRVVRAARVPIYRAPRVRPYRPAARRNVTRAPRVVVR